VSFCENDAAMLAAFEASLLQGEIDANKLTAEGNNNSTTGCNDGSNIHCGCSVSVGPGKPVNSTNTLSGCFNRCESASDCSCRGSSIDSFQHRQVSNFTHCDVDNNSPDCITIERAVAEVQLVKNNALNGGYPPTAESASSSANSVQRRLAGRLSEKVKQTLQQNAKVDTPKRLNRLSAVIEKYDTQAADITDVGPFYGLPVKVKQLLETQRSITEFYRKFFLYHWPLIMQHSFCRANHHALEYEHCIYIVLIKLETRECLKI